MRDIFRINDDKIDSEHEKIFILNGKFENKINRDSEKELKELVKEIMNHVLFHFEDEEAHMINLGVDQEYFNRHQKEHLRIRLNCKSILDNIKRTEIEELQLEVHRMILDIKSHILNVDLEIKNYV